MSPRRNGDKSRANNDYFCANDGNLSVCAKMIALTDSKRRKEILGRSLEQSGKEPRQPQQSIIVALSSTQARPRAAQQGARAAVAEEHLRRTPGKLRQLGHGDVPLKEAKEPYSGQRIFGQ